MRRSKRKSRKGVIKMSLLRKIKSLVTRDLNKTYRLKEAGFSNLVSGMFTLIISIMAITLICLYNISATGILNSKSDVNMIMRKYIIRMESEGYLTPEDESGMIEELKACGMTNIDISGTTRNEVEYGETVYLYVKGDISRRVVSLNDIKNGIWQDKDVHIDESLSSTSQQ